MTIQANQGFGVSVFGATGSGGGGTTSPGGSSLQIQYNAAGSFGGMAGTSWDNTNRSLTLTGATVTTSNPVLNLSQTWDAGAVTFKGWVLNVTDTASASASLLMDLQIGGGSKFSVSKTGAAYGASFGLNSNNEIRYAANSLTAFANGVNVFQLQAGALRFVSGVNLSWVSSSTDPVSGSVDLILRRAAAATLQLGAADAAAPVAQTLGVQSVVAGTTNTAGVNFTIKGSAGTGTGAGGSIIFQTAAAGSTGTTQNAFATALTINPTGTLSLGVNGSSSNPSIGRGTSGFYFSGANGQIYFTLNSTYEGGFLGGIFQLATASYFGFESAGPASAVDVRLYRDAANTLALRNGTNAQTFNVYGTYTDSSNYELGEIRFQSGVGVYIGTKNAGTGSARTMSIGTQGAAAFQIYTSNSVRFIVSSGGTLYPNITLATTMTDGFINIPGAAGAPSGVPTTTTGFPMYYDSTNNKIYVYNGSWRSTAALT